MKNSPARPKASSPCINVCVIDPFTGLCEGCGRTLDEVVQWGMMSEAQRIAIMAQLADRKALLNRPASRCSAKPRL